MKLQQETQNLTSELPELRRVYWSLYQHNAYRNHDFDATTRQHLTDAPGYIGKTLCGRTFPADKGRSQGFKFCKKCVKKAYTLGFEKGFTKTLDFVSSLEND